MGEKNQPEFEDLVVFTLGMLDDLKRSGIIEGGRAELGINGQKRYEELKSQGYSPTTDELEAMMEYLNSDEFDEMLTNA